MIYEKRSFCNNLRLALCIFERVRGSRSHLKRRTNSAPLLEPSSEPVPVSNTGKGILSTYYTLTSTHERSRPPAIRNQTQLTMNSYEPSLYYPASALQ